MRRNSCELVEAGFDAPEALGFVEVALDGIALPVVGWLQTSAGLRNPEDTDIGIAATFPGYTDICRPWPDA